MKTNKNQMGSKLKGIMVILILLLTITPGFSQNGKMSDKSPEEKARKLTDIQKEKIGFNDDQEQQMFDINLKYAKEMEIIAKGGRSLATFRKMRNMNSRKDKEVKTVLDKIQYKTYLKQKEEMRSQMKANHGGSK